mmetsp:Transcript_30871/g.86941  ORF Transcript_30871/g.86941 Transcript_30871/m.86941 type:complete len:209 (-) Transcript_30871:136-762(-)
MPVICIGPVCIPWTCIPAIVFFFWRFAKPLLPEAWAAAIERLTAKVCKFCAPYLEKVPGFKKKPKCAAAAQASSCCTNGCTNAGAAAVFEHGVVGHVTSSEQLDALLKRSKAENFAIVLDFTASWCKPCQAIKPRFKELASQYSRHVFAEVDADDLDDVVARCEVMGLPTFQVFSGGERVGSATGGDETKMVGLISQHLGPPEGKKGS